MLGRVGVREGRSNPRFFNPQPSQWDPKKKRAYFHMPSADFTPWPILFIFDGKDFIIFPFIIFCAFVAPKFDSV